MPIKATVILDSGFFLPMQKDNNPKATEIGLFLSSEAIPDLKVRADGDTLDAPELADIGKKKCKIEVRHVIADGRPKRDGGKGAKGFQDNLLHMKDLYGEHIPINRSKFDCVLRFESGLFCGALIKPRAFIEERRQ